MPDRLPKCACDTHLHTFGDLKRYSLGNPNALYQPPQDCTFEAAQRLHAALGFDRGVLVQPTIYGTDHRLLCDALRSAPSGRYRGVAIVDDSVEDEDLRRLDHAGVRCARFNFGGRFNLAPSHASFRRSIERIRAFGWSAKIFGFGDDFVAVADELRGIDIPAVIDHMGGLDYRLGTAQPAVRLILELLEKDNWWIGLSNGDLRSHHGEPWEDAVEFGRLFYEAAPTRSIWGTDWPHVHRFIRPQEAPESDYGVEHARKRITLLERYVPDRAARDRVLVDNPARLFGFEGG